jgi:hypothetical protein
MLPARSRSLKELDKAVIGTAGLLSLALLLIGLMISPASSQDRELQKETLRLQATEFCAHVKKPPPQIAAALNEAVKQDPKTWLPAILWWNQLAEHYEKAGCGDA